VTLKRWLKSAAEPVSSAAPRKRPGMRPLLGSNAEEPRDPQARVDLQAKMMAASERDEEARAVWCERVAELNLSGSYSWTSAVRTSGSRRFEPGRLRGSGPAARRHATVART